MAENFDQHACCPLKPRASPSCKDEACSAIAKELAEQAVLALASPTAVLIDAKGNIRICWGDRQLSGTAAGEPSVHNIFKMAREGLRQPLTRVLHKVLATRKIETLRNVSVKSNGHFTEFDLIVSPVLSQAGISEDNQNEDMYVVLLVEATASRTSALAEQTIDSEDTATDLTSSSTERDSEALIAALSSQLQAKESICKTHMRSWKQPMRSSNHPTKRCSQLTKNCNRRMKSWKHPKKNCNRSMKS